MLAIAALAAQGKIAMRKGGKATKWAARTERLSVALRENLKRRKAQARGRAAPPAAPAADNGGIVGARDNANNTCRQQPGTPDFRRNRSNE
jgi:hypothetical protein